MKLGSLSTKLIMDGLKAAYQLGEVPSPNYCENFHEISSTHFPAAPPQAGECHQGWHWNCWGESFAESRVWTQTADSFTPDTRFFLTLDPSIALLSR